MIEMYRNTMYSWNVQFNLISYINAWFSLKSLLKIVHFQFSSRIYDVWLTIFQFGDFEG